MKFSHAVGLTTLQVTCSYLFVHFFCVCPADSTTIPSASGKIGKSDARGMQACVSICRLIVGGRGAWIRLQNSDLSQRVIMYTLVVLARTVYIHRM
jgi:hypothetical protein